MSLRTQSSSFFCNHKGLSLVELMVGLAIGMIAVLVAYQSFTGVESTRRTTISVGDMQTGGLYAVFLTGIEVGKAGMAVSANSDALDNCARGLRDGFYPVPVLANRGDTASTGLAAFTGTAAGTSRDPDSDQLFIFYANPKLLVRPVNLALSVAATDNTVNALAPLTNAFLEGDRVVISDENNCATGIVASDGTLDPDTGITTFTLEGQIGASFAADLRTNILNLGPDNEIVRQIYWLGMDGVFRRTILATDPANDRVDPIFSNVERFRVQYGVAANPNDAFISEWVNPSNEKNLSGDDWSSAAVWNANYEALGERIKAIRVSFVIRGDEPEKDLAGDDFNGTLFADCGGLPVGSCPTGEEVTIAADDREKIGWRHRIYETVIPLKNSIWGSTFK
jgi:type IV pilus assembly protein PilW